MDSMGKKTTLRQRLVMTFAIAVTLLCSCLSSSAQQKIVRGTIKGTVTADQGQVIGFRVAAHNLDQKLWYTVFTVKGEYTVPQALPGRYEVFVYEPAYDSPKSPVQLGPGESKTADLAIKKHVAAADSNAAKIEYVSTMDDVYPPGPGLDLVRENCTGCHGDDLSRYHYTREKFLQGIERMTETGPGYNQYVIALGRTIITKSQKDLIADYLVKNFGPGSVEKRLRVDPLVVDEAVAGKMIYVSYDVPDLPLVTRGNEIGAPMVDGITPQRPAESQQHMGSLYISPVDGNVFFSARASNSILRLNPKDLDASERWQNYFSKGEYAGSSGMAIDKQGHVYWAELAAARISELDPNTGKQIRYALPEQTGAVHEVVVDKDGNVGFDLIWGAFLGRMEAKSRRIHMYPTPTPDNGMYGLAVDQRGNLWGAGWQKGSIGEWDVETESVKEFKVPNSWGQVRRIGVDSKGIVWASEHNVGIIARLDPATGKLTEYKLPLNGAQPYDCWPDKSDNIWISDQTHSAMIKLDQKTGKFTFYPMPQPNQSVNKIQVADDNTIWLPTRFVRYSTGQHLYPNGYTADAPPMP
ncbi:MAG: carboxypeptidase regulatory-like domain-containing protein [Candidatus Acidiferrales bacterium]